jgi:secreted trypsin-like serine protease
MCLQHYSDYISDESKGSSVLQFATVNSVPLEDCDSRQAVEVRPLADTQLCAAGNTGEDACKGDSGGPLMDTVQLPTRRTAQIFQVGIVSFGSIPCGAQTSPSVYTRVSAYVEWILDHIAE